jgi:hypothetical protein
MKKIMTENELLEQIAALPREIAPANDVWSSISSRIGRARESVSARKSVNAWWQLAAAASVFVAFAAGLLLGQQQLTTPVQPATGINMASQMNYHGSLAATLAATEIEYQAAFREFISVGASRDSLELRTVEKLAMSWTDLRNTEAGLVVALQENPGNSFLNTKMLELRSRQLKFLKQIAALDHNSRRTTT